MSFREAYEEYKIYAQKRHKKQCFETITQNFNKHVLSYFENMNLENLNVKNIIAWQNNIIEKDFKNNYNKNIYNAFHSFLDFCVLNSYIQTNFLDVIGTFPKKLEFNEYDTYTLLDYFKFRKGMYKNRIYRYFFDFLYFYGSRSGEAMALKFKDLKNNQLYLGHSIHRRGNREIDTPKTKNSYRTLKIKSVMLFEFFILKCYYSKMYGEFSDDYFIFGGKNPLSPTSIKRHKHYACVNRSIREIKTHEFRHSYATRMIRKGVPIEKVSKSLGHSSISITLDIYVHHEKKEKISLFLKYNFFKTITQNFKKLLQSIITPLV